MCNAEVVNNWAQGNEGFTRALRTDGSNLYSYNLRIGITGPDSEKIVFDFSSGGGKFMSQTTSTHVGLARRHADTIHPGDSPIAEAMSQ
jgi:hypothetical protein